MVIYIALAVILVVVIAIILYKKKGAKKMPQGLQIWDANGNITFDSTVNTTYILGSGQTTSTNGSIDVPALANGTPWVLITGYTDNQSLTGHYPYVTVSGTKIQWTYERSGSNLQVNFIYGWY